MSRLEEIQKQKEKLSIEINDAGEWQEYYQKKNKSFTMGEYYTSKYITLKEQYASLVEEENRLKFQSTLENL